MLYIHSVHGLGFFVQGLEGTESAGPAPGAAAASPAAAAARTPGGAGPRRWRRGRRDGHLLLRGQLLLEGAVSDEVGDGAGVLLGLRDRK